jgi:hypothetical protein
MLLSIQPLSILGLALTSFCFSNWRTGLTLHAKPDLTIRIVVKLGDYYSTNSIL